MHTLCLGRQPCENCNTLGSAFPQSGDPPARTSHNLIISISSVDPCSSGETNGLGLTSGKREKPAVGYHRCALIRDSLVKRKTAERSVLPALNQGNIHSGQIVLGMHVNLCVPSYP